MQQVDQTPVWLGFWDAISSTQGSHIIEVRADGSTTVSDHVETFINPALCTGDSGRDGDVDGFDLASFADDHLPKILEDFASSFGRVNCQCQIDVRLGRRLKGHEVFEKLHLESRARNLTIFVWRHQS